tara:strand:+ start:88 stop:1389 length:1302 start_codon:yes stop_codon:yes gene_type:complete
MNVDRNISSQLHREANRHLVGGVNSPVRAFKSVHGDPIYFNRASGAIVEDADGNELIDFVQSWGPLVHGHAHPEIIKKISETMVRGTSFGAPHIGEIELAKRVKERFPSIDLVRFVSSGTEAVMSAVRLARGYTGRDVIVKFEGCYHGHVDSLMVKSGSGLATFGISSSPGVPDSTSGTTIVLPLDDEDALDFVFNDNGEDIAAVIIEPLPANNGLLIQRKEYLEKLRELCDEYGSLLIFDEVISGFRFPVGGYAGHVGINPDITTLGKVIGGGLPVGAYGASKEIMSVLSPMGPVYQAGTLSGNPLAMAAGVATIDLLDDNAYGYMEDLGSLLESEVNSVLEKYSFPMRLVRIGSLFWLSPGHGPLPRRSDEIPTEGSKLYADVHLGLLQRGFMMAPSSYEIGFLSTSHSEEHVIGLAEALDGVLGELEDLL